MISNGVLNLTPDKREAFGEVFRILKPGGQFLYGDIIVAHELSESIRRNIDLWRVELLALCRRQSSLRSSGRSVFTASC